MSTTARITLAIMAICTVLAFVSDRFLQIDAAYAATAGGLAGLFALVIVPQRIRLAVVIWSALVGAYLFFRADTFWGVVVCGLLVIWCLVGLLPVLDGAWRFKTGLVVCSFFAGALVLWPTVSDFSHGRIYCPPYIHQHISERIVPGLDLRGGLRLVYTVEVEEAIRDKRDHIADDMRQDLATAFGFHSGEGAINHEEVTKLETKVSFSRPDSASLHIKFKDPADINKIDDRFLKKYQAELTQVRGPGPDEVTFKIRTDVESQLRSNAVANAKDTVNRRVDGLGLREAAVTTRDEDIIIEVPGENERDFERIKDTIRQTARLEFKMVDDETDFFGKIKDEDLPEGEGIAIYIENAPDGPGKTVQTHFARMTKHENETMTQCRDRFKKWVATLNVPDDHQVGFMPIEDYDAETGKTTEVGWRSIYLFGRTEISGDNITDANVQQPDSSSGPGGYSVALSFNPAGADRFEEITGANVKKRFAIMLDDVVDSAPVINVKIAGGRASITMGTGDPDEQLLKANKLKLVLQSGALPAPISPSNESRIGPSLGRDAIGEGVKGFLASSALVLIALVLYYRKSGVVADLAVLFNLMLQLAILSSFGATMTLPGIAGLALTIGIGVDANVLINERIREELKSGKGIGQAVRTGYEKVFWTIFDGHVTALVAGFVIRAYGSGPVRGFATTLIIGLLASMFTSIVVTRAIVEWFVSHGRLHKAVSF